MDLSERVFQVDQVLAGHIPTGDNCCRFDYTILENVIKDIVKGKLGQDDFRMNAIPNKVCPTFVVAKTAADANARPTVFRTYSGKQIQPSECLIWQAARATSAAPTFFMPMKIDRPRPAITYVDGGLGHNNPAEVALDEARRIWPDCSQVGLVSIGTGRPKANSILLSDGAESDPLVQESFLDDLKSYIPKRATQAWNIAKNSASGVKALMKMGSALAKLATNSEEVHQRVRKQSRFSDTGRFPYFRFNVPRDVGDIGLGEWNRSDELGSLTSNYMKEDEIEEQRDKCVNFLLSRVSSSE